MRQTEAASRTVDLIELEQLLEQFAQLERELEHIRAELTHSHRLATVGTLTSTIAHEYNNILTPIISYAQFALANPDDASLTRKAIERALSGAQRAAQISASLLGFAREQADEGPADLRRVVAEALACLGRPPEKDGIQLEADLPEVRLAISELNLQQVLMNLILNARKVMRRTGGRLAIRGRVAGELLELDVADTGPGIPIDMQSRLFEPFATCGVNAAGTREHDEKGTGLGLSICRDLLERADGAISVTSTPGHGATFHLTIPLADDDHIHTT